MLRKFCPKWIFLHLIISISIVFMALIGATSFNRTATHRAVTDAKLYLVDQISTLSARLQLAIATRTEIVRAMAHIIEAEPNLTKNRFATIASQLTKDRLAFRNLAAAPGLVVGYVYPENGNEAVIGLDYRKTPDQLQYIKKARAVGDTVVAGPIHLVQGGDGIVIRYPLTIRDPITGQENFWGIVSGVVGVDQIYTEGGIAQFQRGTDISLRRLGDDGAQSDVFLGSQKTFTADSITQEIKFPGGSWIVAARPSNGWPQHAESYWKIWLIFAIACASSLILANVSLNLLCKKILMETTLENAIEAIPSGFAFYDKNDRLAIFNSKFREAYKTSSDIIKLGDSFEEILRNAVARGQFAEAVGREEDWINKRLAEHRAANAIVEQETDDGRWIRAEERRTLEGGTVGIRTDITALKAATEAAQEATRMKSEFLNVMSHELRTPLTVILGYTPLLASLDRLPSVKAMGKALAGLGKDHPEKVATVEAVMNEISGFASIMDRNGKHLLSLINNILDLSKMEAGKMALNKEIIESDEIIKSVVDQLQPLALKKKITIQSVQTGGVVFAEKIRLKQILINLVGNAVKFTDTGGILIETLEKDGAVEFRITDTGPGIPEGCKDRIFNQFTQVDGTDVRTFGGTGLGLAISEKLVKLHGGTIGYTSTIGKGSVFWFTIPTKQSNRHAA